MAALGLPSYAHEEGWRRIDALLPPKLRLDPANEPTEEWQRVGQFSIHLDCWRRPQAPASLVLVHGGGGNGRLLAPYGVMAAGAGYEVVAPDLPGYGLTQVPSKGAVRYEHWRDVLAAVLEEQERRHSGPIVIFGLSMGGMLAYDATARTRIPNGLVATCLVDARDPAVRRSGARWPSMVPLIESVLRKLPPAADNLLVPMRAAIKMRGIANEPWLAEVISRDLLAGGNWMPVGFLRTFMAAGPIVPPEAFDVCPVLVTHPADDRWTDVEVTRPFFERLTVEKRLMMLGNAGHFPLEEPGASELRAALLGFLAERSRRYPIPQR